MSPLPCLPGPQPASSSPLPQVMGLRRQRNYAGRWDVLIQQATQCLNRLIQIAARKKRNYILDQVGWQGHPHPGMGHPPRVGHSSVSLSPRSLGSSHPHVPRCPWHGTSLTVPHPSVLHPPHQETEANPCVTPSVPEKCLNLSPYALPSLSLLCSPLKTSV